MRQAVVGTADLRCQVVRQWSRVCGEPVTVTADPAIGHHLRKAVHAVTGLEDRPDGHLAAPIGMNPNAGRGERL